MRLRIATYNIHRCVGRDGLKDFSRVAAVLSEINADIVALQEVTSHHDERVDMLAFLAAGAEMQPVEGFTLNEAGAPYGNALLTRLPVLAVKRFDISVPKREPRGLLEVVIDCHGRELVVWATHLGLGVRERAWQIRRLVQIVDAAEFEASLLMGDLNEWLSWSRALRNLSRRFARASSPATFPAWRPLFKLDRIWIHPKTTTTAVRAHRTEMSRLASDHLPLVADIVY